MTEFQNHPVYSKSVLEILTVANDYCLTLAKLETTSNANLINYLQKVCPLLYLKGSLMPDIEVQNTEANERFFTEEEWETLFNTLRKKFKKDDEFWIVDLSANHNDPVKISLAESLTDIYQELKDFLLLYQKNSLDAKENAVFELKNTFESRWGLILLNAHRQLHFLKTKGIEPETTPDIPELF
jgi:hypothetical protein